MGFVTVHYNISARDLLLIAEVVTKVQPAEQRTRQKNAALWRMCYLGLGIAQVLFLPEQMDKLSD